MLLRTDEAGNVVTLMGERAGSHGAGTFALPGGHLEPKEGWGECASRELMEETGLEVGPDHWRCSFISNDVMEDGNKHYVTIFMEVDSREMELPDPRNLEPHKCKGWSWMRLDSFSLAKNSKVRLFLPMRHLVQALRAARWLPFRVGCGPAVHQAGLEDEEQEEEEEGDHEDAKRRRKA